MGRIFTGPDLCRRYDGQARVEHHTDEERKVVQHVWVRADPKVHISTGFLADPEALAWIQQTYDLTPGCRADVVHGDLRCGDTTCTDDHGSNQ